MGNCSILQFWIGFKCSPFFNLKKNASPSLNKTRRNTDFQFQISYRKYLISSECQRPYEASPLNVMRIAPLARVSVISKGSTLILCTDYRAKSQDIPKFLIITVIGRLDNARVKECGHAIAQLGILFCHHLYLHHDSILWLVSVVSDRIVQT